MVRIIRDKISFMSKGFCYVKYDNQDSIQKALKATVKYGDNELWISKAKKHVKDDSNKNNA